jgi:hypothetical protein
MRANKAIVTFSERAVVKEIEREFSLNIFKEYFYSICSCFTCCSNKRVKGYRIIAEKLPEPLDIIFSNLENGLYNKFWRRTFTNIFSLALIIGSFIGVVALSKV